MKVFILIKDYGYNQQAVYGVTTSEAIAETWKNSDGGYRSLPGNPNLPKKSDACPQKRVELRCNGQSPCTHSTVSSNLRKRNSL